MATKPMQVLTDLIQDSGLQTTPTSAIIKRTFVVINISSKQVLTNALVAPGIPTAGTPHPVMGWCLAREFDVQPIKGDNGKFFDDAAKVIVTYIAQGTFGGGLAFPKIEFGSTLRQEITDTDRRGKQMFVLWDGAKNPNGTYIPQRAEVTKMVRLDTISYEKWFTLKGPADISYPTPVDQLKEKYYGKVNGVDFRGGKPHEWMCTQFDATTEDWGKSYQIQAKLERRPETWDEWAWYKLPNGEVPKNASKKKENGVRRMTEIYFEVDFGDLTEDLKALPTS